MLAAVFYKCHLETFRSLISLISVAAFLEKRKITERRVLTSLYMIVNFSILCSFVSVYDFWNMLIVICTSRIILMRWCIYHYEIIFFFGSMACFEFCMIVINIVTPLFNALVCVCCTSFSILSLSISVFSIFEFKHQFTQLMVESSFCFLWKICLLVGVFSSFMFNIIFDKFGFSSVTLLFICPPCVLLFFSLFFVHLVCSYHSLIWINIISLHI